MEQTTTIYLAKAAESLLSAESEYVNGRYNSCANRCYYACFQAAIAALLQEGIYLVTTVDIADTDEVIAAIGDRLVALQVDEGLPLYVTPLRPLERVLAELRERAAATAPLPAPQSLI
jgi:hypothetical protein